MKQKLLIFISIVLLFFIVLLVLLNFFLFQQKEFAFIEDENGLLFASNTGNPKSILAELSKNGSFVVSPVFLKNNGNNSLMTNPLNLFSGVIVYNSRTVVSLIREMDSEKILSCQTNDGSEKVNRQISAKECEELFNDRKKTIILIEFPDNKQRKTMVIVESNKIWIVSRSFAELEKASFLVSKAMFPNAEKAVSAINAIAGKLG